MSPYKLRILAIAIILLSSARSEENPELKPWETRELSLETGLLWQAGTGTPLSYRLVQTQLSWRSREVFGKTFSNGAHLVLRHRFTLIGSWVQQGPESYYLALAGSPSLELWNAAGTRALFGGAGGGFGLTDSQGVPGGQGQDFTYNWFARAGIEQQGKRGIKWTLAVMFQHMSNRGATDPNPGIDAVGVMAGWSWAF